jgi:hypothetical protein
MSSLFALRNVTTYKDSGYDPRTRRIVSVDGEGQDVDGRHAYTLLAAADDQGFSDYVSHDGSKRAETETKGANHGLSTVRALEFLLTLPKSRYDLVTSFAFTYDVTKILADLPILALRQLIDTENVSWRNYDIEWRSRKYFVVSDRSSQFVNRNGKLSFRRRVKVYDSFSYFQCRFIDALNKSKHLFDSDTRDFIARMKDERDNFTNHKAEDILRYCLMECVSLSTLMRDLLTQLDRLGFHLNDYSGPGSLATEYYRKIDLKHYMPTDHPYHIAGMPIGVATRSYYGGWFETSLSGEVGDVWSADINSAYPAIAASLPCLQHGQFIHTDTFIPSRLGFYKVGSHTSGPWPPFPFRTGKEHYPSGLFATGPGSVIHAHGGIRWVGSAEVAIAVKHFGSDAIPIFDGWVWEPRCAHKPFASLLELFEYRKQLKAAGDGAEKAIKLILNAVYGKLCQSIGWKVKRYTRSSYSTAQAYDKPPYQSYPWAAWITSGTRAMILDMALKGGKDVISIATDGVLARKPIEGYVDSKDLGGWEIETVANCWVGMPGIYAYTKGPDISYKTRGFNKTYFPQQYMRDTWQSGNWEIDNIPLDLTVRYGVKPMPMRAFVPIKQGIRRKDPRQVIGEWIPTHKTLDMRNTKRVMIMREGVDPTDVHDGGIVEYEPYVLPNDLVSSPYRPKSSWEDVLKQRAPDDGYLYIDDDDDEDNS